MKFSLKFKTGKQKKVSHVTLEQSSAPEYTNPMREWTIGLGVAILLLVVGGVAIGFDFYKQFGAPSKPTSLEQKASEYNDAGVRFYANEYREREQAFGALREKRPQTVVTQPVVTEEDSSETSQDETIPEATSELELGQ